MNDNDFSAAVSERRFGGIARLYGADALNRFAAAHVCVVGVGGVGSWAVEALARSGIGALTLIDLDNVAESNVNRQLHALTCDFGKAKVTALHERILQINPACRVTEIEDFVTEDNLPVLFRRPFDFVIDAIDQMRVKAAMAAYFVRHGQPFILSGGAGGQKNPSLIQMRVPCVYSLENITPPQTAEACAAGSSPQGLSCAGYGASMLVTAPFGLYCAQAALEHIASGKAEGKKGKGGLD